MNSHKAAMETILAGRYQIVRHLGGGGFGQTFLAKDMHLPGFPLCVVKQLKPTVSEAAHLETAQRLFNQEAETLYRLGYHDQIPRLLAHFEQAQEFYLVQEYIEGQPLNREIRSGHSLSEPYTVAMMQDILHVLAFVHQQHVIHRDIKPANLIRRNWDCKVVLIDFGAVKEVRTNTIGEMGPTSITVAIGSPGYMPIEQQAFKPHFSSDIYAVGMVCLEALTGLKPKSFPRDAKTGELSCDLLRDVVTISPELAVILDTMVRYDYRQRYASAIEALHALQQMLGEGHVGVPLLTSDDRTVSHQLPTTTSLPPEWEAVPAPPLPPDTPSGPASRSHSGATSGSTQLSNALKTGLEQLMAGVIGPIAAVVVKKTLAQASNSQEWLELLLGQLPETERSRIRPQALQLIQNLGDPFVVSSSQTQNQGQSVAQSATALPTTTPRATPGIDPAFVKQCEQELASAIGPIASVLIKRTLSRHPEISRPQLVEELTKHLPNDAAIARFRQLLLRP